MKDAQVVKLANRLRGLRDEQNELKSRISTCQEQLLAGLEERDTEAIESEGLRISRVQAENVKHDAEKFKERLSSKQYKMIIREEIDKAKLEAFVLAGEIDVDLVAECSEVTRNAPYVKVTPLKEKKM